MRRLTLICLLSICGCSGRESAREDYVFKPLERPGVPKAAPAVGAALDPATPRTLDLLTALRLAGADNLDIAIVETRLEARRAGTDAAFSKYLPDLRLGFTALHHNGLRQAADSQVADQPMRSFGAGPAVSLNLDPVEARFQHLRALQLEDAAEHQARRTKAETVVHSAILYLELVRASGLVVVAGEAVERSQAQVKLQEGAAELQAELGVELARARAELSRDQEALLAARGGLRQAGINLATWLRLPPQVPLIPEAEDIEPLTLVRAERGVADLLDAALAASPDLAEMRALGRAAEEMKNAATWGPWTPEIFAAGSFGAYGGGPGNGNGYEHGDRSDFAAGLSWTLRGLGLGDRARVRRARAEALEAGLQAARTRDLVNADVVRGWTRSKNLLGRIEATRKGIEAAEETLKLVEARFEAGDAIQLEVLEAIRAVAAARAALIDTTVSYNQTQHLLHYRVRGGSWRQPSQ
jgi:outer membrane protein TolC